MPGTVNLSNKKGNTKAVMIIGKHYEDLAEFWVPNLQPNPSHIAGYQYHCMFQFQSHQISINRCLYPYFNRFNRFHR